MVIREHNRTNPDPKYDINSTDRRNFDPRPLINRTITNEKKTDRTFFKNMRDKLSAAVINITAVPPPDQDVPSAVPDIATDVTSNAPEASGEEKIRMFTQKLSFSAGCIVEHEKATRSQAKSEVWTNQMKGRITASNFHGVHTKVTMLLRKKGESVKIKVTPLSAKLLMPRYLSNLPTIQWECTHEVNVRQAFFYSESAVDCSSSNHTLSLVLALTTVSYVTVVDKHAWIQVPL